MSSNRVIVLDLRTGKAALTYVGISPRRAVMAAHAQDHGDYETWNYETRYGDLVTDRRYFVFCGNFAALKED